MRQHSCLYQWHSFSMKCARDRAWISVPARLWNVSRRFWDFPLPMDQVEQAYVRCSTMVPLLARWWREWSRGGFNASRRLIGWEQKTTRIRYGGFHYAQVNHEVNWSSPRLDTPGIVLSVHPWPCCKPLPNPSSSYSPTTALLSFLLLIPHFRGVYPKEDDLCGSCPVTGTANPILVPKSFVYCCEHWTGFSNREQTKRIHTQSHQLHPTWNYLVFHHAE